MAQADHDFLETNGAKDGVTTTASGLQYRVIKDGSGQSPSSRDDVLCHYKGSLVDGTEFDSSHRRGQPAKFPVNALIPGFSEGLELMQVGSTYEFVIPADIGYGARGAPPSIPGGATLIFEVELIDIV